MHRSAKAVSLWAMSLWIFILVAAWVCPNFGWAAKPAPQAKQDVSLKKAVAKKTVDAGKPFVIRETYRERDAGPANPEASKGIVGLDMLVEPDRYPVVQRVFKGTPAQIQGIRIGDAVLAINGVRTLHQSLWELDALISDVPGDVVTLTILRDGKLRKFGLTVMPLSEANASVKSNFGGLIP